ncbi:hypothetical protein NL676_008737 [Syzygium grande]|nr:hypothetical protein NL676_008737 [Syzygium grande]
MIYACNQIAEFFRPSRGRIQQVELLGSGAQALSPPGWILVSNSGCEYRIFNPHLGVSIELPALEKLRHKSRLSVELEEP